MTTPRARTRTRRRAAGLLAAAATTAVLSACGTTVPLDSPEATRDALGRSGSAASGTGGVSGNPALPGNTGAGNGATQPGGSGFDGQPGGAGTSGTGSPANTSGQSGRRVFAPGVDATSVTIGIAYQSDGDAANQAMGADIRTVDRRAVSNILIDDINSHGGVAGRKLKAVFYAQAVQTAEPYEQQAQAECAYFTQDHKVFLVIDGSALVGPMARPCLHKAGVAQIGGLITGTTETDYTRYPFTVDPQTISLERLYATLVPRLASRGFFSPWDRVTGRPGTTRAKVGIVGFDYYTFRQAISRAVVPALRAQGYAPDPDDVILITLPPSYGESGPAVAEIQNAVLKLSQNGVDHVLLMDPTGSLTQYFLTYAHTQRYFPRYGGQTGNAWQVLLDSGLIQPETLNGGVGLGWLPMIDLPAKSGDGQYPTAARRACFALLRSKGQAITTSTEQASAAGACDAFRLIQSALNRADGLTRGGFVGGMEGLGSSHPTASQVGIRLGPGRHDGVGSYYDMHFEAACRCVRYAGSPRQFR